MPEIGDKEGARVRGEETSRVITAGPRIRRVARRCTCAADEKRVFGADGPVNRRVDDAAMRACGEQHGARRRPAFIAALTRAPPWQAKRTSEPRSARTAGWSAGGAAERELPRVAGDPGEETLLVQVVQRQSRGRPAAGSQPADQLMG
jgi:hypothetical protein